MPDDTNNPGWFPSWVPDFFPRHDRELLPKCPEGSHLRIGQGCVPDGTPRGPSTTETGRQTQIDEGFAGPLPVPRDNVRPPKLPSAPAPRTLPSPVDSFPRQLPVVRGPAPAAAVLGAIRDLSVAGTLSFVWALAFGPMLGYGWRERSLFDPLPRNAGPPRRRTPRVGTISPNAPRPFWDETYRPGYRSLPDWLRPIRGPFPIPRTWSIPDVDSPTALPQRPRTMPGPRTRVPTVPAPAPTGWTLGDPITGPGYDPFTVAPPSPRPSTRPAPRTQPRSPAFPFPIGDFFDFPDARDVPGLSPRSPPGRVNPRTPATPPRVQPPRQPTLTPINDPVPFSQPQPQRADPCARAETAQREKRRRRAKECKRFRTETRKVRICEDK